jgi:hypothetical protein
MRRSLRFWLGVFISLLFLYLALKGQRLDEVGEAIKEANFWWLIPAVAVYFMAVGLRTYRWHFLLRPIKAISLRDLFPVVVIGYMGNNVFPLRAGELIRAYVLKRKETVSATASLATIIVERIFDGITMLIFVFAILPLVPANETLRQIIPFASLLFFGALFVFLIMASSPKRFKRTCEWFISHLIPHRFQEPVGALLDRFIEGLEVLRRGQEILLVLVISVLLWLVESAKYWFVMQGFPFQVPFYVLVFTTAIVNLATSIPSSPGYLGTFELTGIWSLRLFGVAQKVATSFILVLHAALWFPVTALGFFFMWRESLTWREIETLRQRPSEKGVEVPSGGDRP